MNSQLRADMKGVLVVQIGLCTADLPASLRLYNQVFGFKNAGGNVLWGETIRVQNLSPDSHALMWWMVNSVPFFQLEFFHHTNPKQRPLRADWRPSDQGWGRFGLAVADFDRVVQGLEHARIPVLGTRGAKGQRRLAFRDPHIGVIVEVIEKPSNTDTTLVYAANSVADIEASRKFYGEVVGGKIEPLETLHAAEDEALWGMTNVARKGFVVTFESGACFEILEYTNPKGRPKPDDYRVSDQGIMNMALGSRSAPPISALIKRIIAAGGTATQVLDTPDSAGTYIIDPGCELEILAMPEAADSMIGFTAALPFLDEFILQR